MNIETIPQLIKSSAAQHPNSSALIYQQEEISFRELQDLSLRTAKGLSEIGIKKNDRVAFWLPNCPAYVVLYLACAQLGAIAVAVNTRFRSSEIADILSRSRAKTLILWPGFRNLDFLKILAEIDESVFSHLESLILYSEEDATQDLPPLLQSKQIIDYTQLIKNEAFAGDCSGANLGCNIFTTSGTTKAPKFVLHTHASIVRHALDVYKNLSSVIKDGAFFQTLPFCGVFGFNHLTAALAGGKASVLQSGFNAEEALLLLDRHSVHYISVTDDMLLALLEADDRNPAMPSLNCCGYGAFNLPPDEITNRAALRGVDTVGLYGMSEVQALYARRDHQLLQDQRYLPGGKLISKEARVRVRNPDTGQLLDHGESGELEFSGPSMMSEYFENLEATADIFTSDGFLKSGDLGYMTSETDFVFETRMGDTLRLGGYLVSPAEIENHLIDHKTVSAAQVVAILIKNKLKPYAFIIANAETEIDQEELKEHCKKKLAAFKVPVIFHLLESFPTTNSPNGKKIQRARLRQLAEERVNS